MNIKRIIYVAGVVMDDKDLVKLIDSNMPNKFCHHVTLKFGNIDKLPSFIGKEFDFESVALVKDDKAIVLAGYIPDNEVEDYMIDADDKHGAHITICTAEGVKPVYSNELLIYGDHEAHYVTIPCRVGAFVVFEDDNTGWVFNN